MSLKVKVRLFAQQREQAGWSEREVEVADGATVAHLVAALGRDYPAIASAARHLVAAVNADYVEPDTVLHPGDEVALIPPVSGGLSCPNKVSDSDVSLGELVEGTWLK